MGSRTTMKLQIMRQMVMDEEKEHKEISHSNTGNYNNSYKGSYNSMSHHSDTLPSLTSTMVAPEKSYPYCKPYLDSPNQPNYNIDSNNAVVDDLPFITNDYNDPISSTGSPYLMQNMYAMENKMNFPSFSNDFSLQSSFVENNMDSNSYNSQYHNLNHKPNHIGQMQDIYGYKTSFSCPVTGDQMQSTTNQRRMSNSNSAMIGGVSLNYDDKRTQLKDRKKESHNRIERKRRDFINQQIVELSNLLPNQMMSEGESKKNKGNILKNSVVYIQYLQNKNNNTTNFVKETDLAFTLVDDYRKQVQELQQQIKSIVSQNSSSSLHQHNLNENYNEYLMLHEQNRIALQTNNRLLLPTNNSNSNNLSPEAINRYSGSSYIKSPLSPLENNGSAFKLEPSSAHSSNDNSMSNTYRIDEEPGAGFNSIHDMLSPNNNNYLSVPSIGNDLFFNSSNHYHRIGRHKFESMEC